MALEIDHEWPEKLLRGWAQAYRDSPEYRFPSDPSAEFFPVDMDEAAKEIERLRSQVETLQNRDERWRMRMRDLREMEMDGDRAKMKRYIFDLIMHGPDVAA